MSFSLETAAAGLCSTEGVVLVECCVLRGCADSETGEVARALYRHLEAASQLRTYLMKDSCLSHLCEKSCDPSRPGPRLTYIHRSSHFSHTEVLILTIASFQRGPIVRLVAKAFFCIDVIFCVYQAHNESNLARFKRSTPIKLRDICGAWCCTNLNIETGS